MTDDEEMKIKNYIYMIDLAVIAKRLFDVCLY